MLFLQIVMAIFFVTALFFRIFGEVKKKQGLAEWTYTGRVIAGILAIILISCGIMILTLNPLTDAGDQQFIVTRVEPNTQRTFHDLTQTGRLQQHTATGKLVQDVSIYGTFSETTIVRSETVSVRRWTVFLFVGLGMITLVWAILWYKLSSKRPAFYAKYFNNGYFHFAAESAYCIVHGGIIGLLMALSISLPFEQEFPTEYLNTAPLGTIMVDSEDAGTVTLIMDGQEQIYYGAESLYQAFLATETVGRQYALNYNPQTDTLFGVAEVIVEH